MSPLLRVTIVLIALVFSVLTIRLLVRRRLSERWTILWLLGTVVILLIAAVPQAFNWVASRLGVSYPPSLLYLLAIMTLFFMVLYQSMQLSKLDERVRVLGQTIALLNFQADQNWPPAVRESLLEAAASLSSETSDGQTHEKGCD